MTDGYKILTTNLVLSMGIWTTTTPKTSHRHSLSAAAAVVVVRELHIF
jgi:hypothetical protein